jgi:hypothetical protein
MNAIQFQLEIDLYIDRARNARYYRYQYDTAVNDAIRLFIEQRAGDKKQENPVLNYKSEQQVADELYTLYKTQTAAPTADIALYPADYYFLTSAYATIGGVRSYCRPVVENQLGPLLKDSFRKPTDIMPYYFQELTGFKIYHGTGTITSAELNYLKTPATFTIGTEAQLINAGAAVVTIGQSYIATEISVQNGVTYNPGTQFTAAVTTTLASGQVILASNTTTSDLPDKTHKELAKISAEILLGTVGSLTQSNYVSKEASKS